ncbi:VCBS repeat-containing protein [Thermoactinomyces sp. DSM 45892]|uniref:FG-GAP repeat domain-containing protein n=1 Tax=Thermoactinomyces sp. DSM 45892 TaxID=1882753 RepID=UPI00089C0258|nr:VCBS repeat-containing protein [Thermoactinomyces sp. DSM 45892]SDY79588.1 hypothetical protein SAMN05444416_108115 [Thermoactinomyces sp. DSM 45892]
MKEVCTKLWLKSGILVVSGLMAMSGFHIIPQAFAASDSGESVVTKDSGKRVRYMITQVKRDVTGDRVKDVITLIGQKEFPQDGWNEKLYLRVVDGKSHKRTQVEVGNGGYEPSLRFGDFNGDRITDIRVHIFSGATGHSPIENYYYTVDKGSLSEIK